MKEMKASISLTRDQVGQIVDTYTTVMQEDTSRDGMTLFFDPDTVKVSEWEIHPEAHPFIAL
jgi:hypothetical protein